MADTARMTGKNVLITGGTAGIGKATAVGLAALGARVGITGRDRVRAEAAAADIRAASGNTAVDVFTADLSSQAEVRRLAGEVLDAYPRLDVLVNNVGGFWAHRHVTADGLEHTFALNHLAPFLLTNLRHRDRAAPGRGEHQLRWRRPSRYQGDTAADAPVYENPCRRCGHHDPSRVLPGGRRSHRPILCQPQTENLQQGVLRHRRRGTAVEDQRRPGRPHRRRRSLTA
jgi:NAD(P)-dependent dehydrogenase (short-subunit alcohol dehydrogenase family)